MKRDWDTQTAANRKACEGCRSLTAAARRLGDAKEPPVISNENPLQTLHRAIQLSHAATVEKLVQKRTKIEHVNRVFHIGAFLSSRPDLGQPRTVDHSIIHTVQTPRKGRISDELLKPSTSIKPSRINTLHPDLQSLAEPLGTEIVPGIVILARLLQTSVSII